MQADNLEVLEERQVALKDIDEEGIIATPSNSRYNELVNEAARLSIQNYAREAAISYGETPGVKLR